MPALNEVKNRIKSVENISQITRALEAVSASRVRKAQARAFASRAFSDKAWEILLNLQNATQGALAHPLLTERTEINRILMVLITSDRGLAGSYNTNIIRVANRFIERMGKPAQIVTVGRKGRDSMIRVGADVVAEFSDMPAEPTIADIAPISQLATEMFLNGDVDEVVIAYTDFVNMLTQRPVVLGWLPLTVHTIAQQVAGEYYKDTPSITEGDQDYEYEPNAAAVLEEIVPRFTQLQLYQALLESLASEHAARMAAMRNATDNASQLVDDLTLEYNKARQAAITSEILDIVGGANALQQAIDSSAKEILDSAHPTAPRSPAPGVVASSHDSQYDYDVAEVKSNGNGSSNGNGAATSTKSAAAEAVATETSKESAESSETVEETGKPDDLTRIEGIGPKMSGALISAGIETFEKLAKTTEDEIRAAIEAAGMRFAPSLVTWAEQAEYAAKGDWEGLQKMQDNLTGGRRD